MLRMLLSGRKKKMTGRDESTVRVDIQRLLKAIWSNIWIVIVATILCGAIVLGIAYYCVTPLYEADTKLYVNNSSFTVGAASFSISDSSLSAAQDLVQTYLVILFSRNVLGAVIEQAELPYTYEELAEMITAESVNGTEIFCVTVSSASPEEAKKIANTIAVILPGKIASIVEGSSVRVVDYAVLPEKSAFPNLALGTVLGALAGMMVSVIAIIISELMNNTIRGEEYLALAYTKVPLLAVIPDAETKSKPYSRGYYRSSYERK